MGDNMTIRKEAIQIGYLCCVQLKNFQKQKTFEHRLSENELAVPVLEQTTSEVRVRLPYSFEFKLLLAIYLL